MTMQGDIQGDARAAARETMLRLFNRATGQFMHLSGDGETPGRDWAWSGTLRQAQSLRAQHKDAGKPWPYRARRM